MATFHPSLYFQQTKKNKWGKKQNLRSTKPKSPAQSTPSIKQIQNMLKLNWTVHISNKLKGKKSHHFHSISHQSTITREYSLNVMMTLPLLPRGFSASLTLLLKLSHLPPFYISPHIQFAPFWTLGADTIACLQFLFTILWFLPAAREKPRANKTTNLLRCA